MGWEQGQRCKGAARRARSERRLQASTGVALLTCSLVFAEGLLWMGLLFS